MQSRSLLVSATLVVAMLIGPAVWPLSGRTVLAETGLAASSGRAAAARARVLPKLERRLAPLGLKVGDRVFMRIFKQERELELWMQAEGETYTLVHTYPICAYSGELGPKTKQGDGQAPEGFYSIRSQQLNPWSSYHLSFNLGYPNAYERTQGWTGNYLMVHGNCVSIGCYAMGDAAIEEIYTLLGAALGAGQRSVDVHAYPFAFDEEWRSRHKTSEHTDFWAQLEPGYLAFENSRLPPKISVRNARYHVDR